jgi:hypothetical protein
MCLTLLLGGWARFRSLTGDTTAKLALNFQDRVKFHGKLSFYLGFVHIHTTNCFRQICL